MISDESGRDVKGEAAKKSKEIKKQMNLDDSMKKFDYEDACRQRKPQKQKNRSQRSDRKMKAWNIRNISRGIITIVLWSDEVFIFVLCHVWWNLITLENNALGSWTYFHYRLNLLIKDATMWSESFSEDDRIGSLESWLCICIYVFTVERYDIYYALSEIKKCFNRVIQHKNVNCEHVKTYGCIMSTLIVMKDFDEDWMMTSLLSLFRGGLIDLISILEMKRIWYFLIRQKNSSIRDISLQNVFSHEMENLL